MHIALAQINTTVGNLDGNAEKIVAFARWAAAEGAVLVVFPELCVTGYPPQDLPSNETFISNVEATTVWIARQAPPNIGIHINETAGRDVIPPRVIDRTPSAELRPGQTDPDELPPYFVLDGILRRYIEDRMDVGRIAEAAGGDPNLIQDILERVDRHEYKRRQAPPVLRVTRKAFGSDRRMPLVSSGIRHEHSPPHA